MTLLLLFLLLVSLWCCLLVRHALVGAWCLTATPTLCCLMPMLTTVVGFPVYFVCDMPSFIGIYPNLSLCNGTKTGNFYHLFCSYDWPTVANVDPNSSAACTAAFQSQGFFTHTHAYVVGLRPYRN